ncbi:LOW QUALITY PROTEIN: sarcosine dehydrogenase, mitochondrial-like, partial [Homalodisca vitripennis]|uniref:LOW QUALITY PROTEIN: sarcosine dehydrogenase, mitochondrial-like n=1 Tax=Homalodisca vitripennis TaxID=197043 RepID=UPI001EEC3738
FKTSPPYTFTDDSQKSKCQVQCGLNNGSHECYTKKYSIVYPHDQPLAARNLKKDPFHEELLVAGAFYEEMQAYERPGWFTPQGHAPVPPYDWYGAYGTPKNKDRRYVDLLKGDLTFKFSKHHHVIGAECLSCREHVVVFDMSYFSKLYLTGPDAQEAADWLFTADTNGPLGNIVYSCILNKQGGIEGDCLVIPIGTGCGTLSDPIFKGRGFYIVAAGASASQSGAHLNTAIQQKGFKVALTNLSEDIGLLAVQGPKSRELLQNIIDADLSNEVFPYRTARIIKVAGHTVRALRTSFVGELGWELHIPWQSCIPVYNAIWEEGLKFGLRQAGYRALYSLSSEK